MPQDGHIKVVPLSRKDPAPLRRKMTRASRRDQVASVVAALWRGAVTGTLGDMSDLLGLSLYWLAKLFSVAFAGFLIVVAVRSKLLVAWVAAVAETISVALSFFYVYALNTMPRPPRNCGPAPDVIARPECALRDPFSYLDLIQNARSLAAFIAALSFMWFIWILVKRSKVMSPNNAVDCSRAR